MNEHSLAERLQLFLYGTPHLVGSLAVLVGLGLYFSGVIDRGWGIILLGLYGGAYLTARALSPGEAVSGGELDEDHLLEEVGRLVASARPRMPAEALPLLDSIAERAQTLVPVLNDLAGQGVIGDKVRHETLAGLTRYLPETLGRYLVLPAAYLKLHQGGNNSPAQLMIGQLQLIDAHLARCIDDAFGDQATRLAVHGRFLAEKMGAGVLP